MNGFQALRKEKGLTQAELASASGIRQATISAIEQGQTRPRVATRQRLAEALQISLDVLEEALVLKGRGASPSDWPFLQGLDRDLREGLAQALVCDWTHHSTSLEGNTISAGDTLFILQEGLTISGKSLREHQEIHGHAQALNLLSAWLHHPSAIQLSHLHQLHRAVQTGADLDAFAPIGAWKIEDNGTMVLTTGGERVWHDYSRRHHIPALMQQWFSEFQHLMRQPLSRADELLDAFTQIHLSFTAITPYADGNGRLARLLANLPLLRAGHPPLIIQSDSRKPYITLLGDYTLRRGLVSPDGTDLVCTGPEYDALIAFFRTQWQTSQTLVSEFHQRQERRHKIPFE